MHRSIVVPTLIARRNAVRPLEVVGGILWCVASYWLQMVFPFDFTHLTDTLPVTWKTSLFWISNGLARLILMIGVAAGAGVAVYNAVSHVVIRQEMKSRRESSETNKELVA